MLGRLNLVKSRESNISGESCFVLNKRDI